MATLTRSFDDSVYRPGKPVLVTIHVAANPGTLAYALEEKPPTGWAVSEISHGGNYVGGLVKVGVFFDNLTRDITYKTTPPEDSSATWLFSGVVSLDGSSSPIGGSDSLSLDDVAPQPPL